MRYFVLILAMCIALPTAGLYGQAGVPKKISYQSALTVVVIAKTKIAKKGTYSMRFELYNAPAAGAVVLTNEQMVTVGTKGVYTTTIGEDGLNAGNLDGSVFDRLLWLKITLLSGADTRVIYPYEVPGRVQLTSVPYALGPWASSGADVYYNSGNIGIGTTSPTAKLHIAGTPGTDGIRFPDGTLQTTAVTGGVSGWNLTGNAGTTAGTNFVGTTDAQAFDIRTNNVLRTRITTKGQIETYNTGQSVFVGEGAGANDDLSNNINVFVGYRAGFSNTTGSGNTANGWRSLFSNTTGFDNTANGADALYSNTTGSYNTANGLAALYFNTTGNNNTATGWLALYSNTTGYSNTANGYRALYFNTAGYDNTANGMMSLYSNTTGNYNTALGYSAFFSGTAYNNSTALGFNTIITASNQVRVGNSSVTSIGGQMGWTTISDARFKKDITETIPGLAFILKLRPVTYHLDMDGITSFLKTPDSLRLRESEAVKSKMLQTGFVAQEVEKSAQELGYDFSGIDKPENENDYYGLRYAEFVVPLVKAVQEQQKIIEELTRRIEELERK